MNAAYNRSPTFQMLDLASGTDIVTVNHRGYWVHLGIDGTEVDDRTAAAVSLSAESTSA